MNDKKTSDPTLRRIAMRPAWQQLLFLHWETDAEALQRRLPPGLEVDLFDGKTYVGLVPFTMRNVRPRGLPHLSQLSHSHENFHEVNVRIYVKHPKFGPGVWFFSLDAASAPAVCAARLWYKLPYFYANMHLRHKRTDEGVIHEYFSQRRWPNPVPAACNISYKPTGLAAPAVRGTLEYFLAERYLLYSFSQGHLYTGRVRHKPYPLQGAKVFSLEENLIQAANIIRPDSPPLAHYAKGVQVDIFSPIRIS